MFYHSKDLCSKEDVTNENKELPSYKSTEIYIKLIFPCTSTTSEYWERSTTTGVRIVPIFSKTSTLILLTGSPELDECTREIFVSKESGRRSSFSLSILRVLSKV